MGKKMTGHHTPIVYKHQTPIVYKQQMLSKADRNASKWASKQANRLADGRAATHNTQTDTQTGRYADR